MINNVVTSRGGVLQPRELAALIKRSASGSLTHFEDGAGNVPIAGLTVDSAATTLYRVGENLLDSSACPKSISSSSYVQFYIPKLIWQSIYHQTVTVHIDGVLGEEKERFSLYIYDGTNNQGLTVGGSQDLTEGNGFTRSGTVSISAGATITPSDNMYIRVYARPYDTSGSSMINAIYLSLGDQTDEEYAGETYTLTNGTPDRPVTTVKGTNNIWADTGDVSVDYYADATLIIESLESRLAALENA